MEYNVEGKKYFRIQCESENLERNRAYFWSLFRNGATAKEIQAYGAGGFFLGYCKKTDLEMTTKMYRFARDHSSLLLFVMCLSAVGYGAGLAAAASLASAGVLAVSGFSACISAFLSLQNAVFNTAAEAGYMSEHGSGIHEYYEFLSLASEPQGEDTEDAFGELTLQNVSFAYPGSAKNALTDISFSLREGRRVAVVGENGSGKTTLLKLMTGVYAPASGKVLLNGKDLAETNAAAVRRLVALQPQRYIKYKGTVRENIFLSDPGRRGDGERQRELFGKSALAGEGLALDTQLGREYGGEELSEGQWQQLAFLRLLYRSPGIMVLDEPTSGLDARAENEMYEVFRSLTKDRTALFISHRMALSRIADEIVFLENGRIEERGSHAQLMRKKGKYRAMYEMQSGWYR